MEILKGKAQGDFPHAIGKDGGRGKGGLLPLPEGSGAVCHGKGGKREYFGESVSYLPIFYAQPMQRK